MNSKKDKVFFYNYSIVIGLLAVMIIIFLVLALYLGVDEDAVALLFVEDGVVCCHWCARFRLWASLHGSKQGGWLALARGEREGFDDFAAGGGAAEDEVDDAEGWGL